MLMRVRSKGNVGLCGKLLMSINGAKLLWFFSCVAQQPEGIPPRFTTPAAVSGAGGRPAPVIPPRAGVVARVSPVARAVPSVPVTHAAALQKMNNTGGTAGDVRGSNLPVAKPWQVRGAAAAAVAAPVAAPALPSRINQLRLPPNWTQYHSDDGTP